jgi:hypothetical protein
VLVHVGYGANPDGLKILCHDSKGFGGRSGSVRGTRGAQGNSNLRNKV